MEVEPKSKHRTGKTPRAWSRDQLRNGRDEMNLVEFPFATLSDRAGGVQVLEFQVADIDRESPAPVEQKLTVTGDPKHGPPTAKDEDVSLALLHLTNYHPNSPPPTARFTRHELIRLLD